MKMVGMQGQGITYSFPFVVAPSPFMRRIRVPSLPQTVYYMPNMCFSTGSSRLAHRHFSVASSVDGVSNLPTDSDTSISKTESLVVIPPPNLHGKSPRKFWNAASLAFLGDGVWELYIRRHNFFPPRRVSDYYAVVVTQVRAEAQAEAYEALSKGDFLTEEELDVLRWGRNATGTSPKRVSQGGMSKEVYRAATAIECLAGYLYLTNSARLHQLMIHLGYDGKR